ncbi:MAG: ribosome biogenesis GTP-binding protein YihA/YsxC [Pseudomonadota bacterium]
MALELNKKSTQFMMGFAQPADFQKWSQANNEIAGFAFLGRSNVGKSSLINALWGKVAQISKTPGRTRQINLFSFSIVSNHNRDKLIGPYYFFDLPGYGHADASHEAMESWAWLIQSFFDHVSPSIMLVNLRDSRHPQEKADLHLEKMLQDYRQFKSFLVYSKIDKLHTQKERASFDKEKIQIKERATFYQQTFEVSATEGDGLKELEKSMGDYLTCFKD